jgi:hypothetical protein
MQQQLNQAFVVFCVLSLPAALVAALKSCLFCLLSLPTALVATFGAG